MRLDQNLPTYSFLPVERVESVAKKDLTPRFIDKQELSSPKNHSTKANLRSVENVAKKDLTSYFSTLSTEMKKESVESHCLSSALNISDLKSLSQIPHIPQEKTHGDVDFSGPDRESSKLVLEWLQVVLDEGHIEPSQSITGRVVGWPSRNFSIESLFVNFDLWCRQRGMLRWSIPERRLFFSILDEVFDRRKSEYAFPSLSNCRDKFAILKGKI